MEYVLIFMNITVMVMSVAAGAKLFWILHEAGKI